MKYSKKGLYQIMAVWFCVFMLFGIMGPAVYAADQTAAQVAAESSVTDQPIDFFIRYLNDNTPMPGTATSAMTYLSVGGACKSTPNNHFTPFKITLPVQGTKVNSATVKLRSTDNKLPFALFYMPNENWLASDGLAAIYSGTKTVFETFHRYSNQTYMDIYPDFVKEEAADGGYETAEAAKTMLQSAADGALKENYLGVYGMLDEYHGEFLTIDITAAVNRAVEEGKSSVSLVMSAPGTLRSQFLGIDSGVALENKASYSMNWNGGIAPPPADSGSVSDQLLAFYYRCINNNPPVVDHPGAAGTSMAVGGAYKGVTNNHYTPFKINLPSGVGSGSQVTSATLKLRSVDSKYPFALFYMPNENWTVDSGAEAKYDNTKTVREIFNRDVAWSKVDNQAEFLKGPSYTDIYPENHLLEMAEGAYVTGDAAKTMLESAATGSLRENYLGVYGMPSEYKGGDYLTIDITAAVQRAIDEEKSSVSFVMSAPGVGRNQFGGLGTGIASDIKPSFSMSWKSSGTTPPPVDSGTVDDKDIDFYYRYINDNTPVVGTPSVDSKLGAGGFNSSMTNNCYTAFKLSLPPGLSIGTKINTAALSLHAVYDTAGEAELRRPFALFYMPNDNWSITSGKETSYDGKKAIYRYFNKWSSEPESYSDLYPGYDSEQAKSGAYEPESAAKAIFEKASEGILKTNFLGVYGGISEYNGDDLTIDITAAVQRAVNEGLTSVSFVMSAPGTLRTQFAGLAGGIPDGNRPRYSMSWGSGGESGGGVPKPKTETLKTYYDDQIVSAWLNGYQNETKAVSHVEKDATNFHSGTSSFRMKIHSPEADGTMMYMNWVDNGSFNLESCGLDDTYLELYYQPIQLQKKVEFGFTCGDNPFASLRVDISEYVTLTQSDVTSGTWKRILIPLKDFKNSNKAVFYPNGTPLTELDWTKSKGFSIAVSDENGAVQKPDGIGTDAVNICRIDDVQLIRILTAPESLDAETGDTSVTLFWNAASGVAADRYEIYRDGEKIASVSDTTYTDTGLETGTEYLYQVVAFRGESISEAADITVTTGGAPPPPGISVKKLEFQDGNGNTVSMLPSAGGTIACKVTAENTLEEAKAVKLILAYYKKGVFQDMKISEITIPAGGGSITGDTLEIPAGSQVKALVWEDLNTMAPVRGNSVKEL